MQRLLKSLSVLALSLVLGILVNVFNWEGIDTALLLTPERDQLVESIVPDSAFSLYLQGSAIFVDARASSDFEIDRLPRAQSLPLTYFLNVYQSPDSTDSLKTIITYCFDPQCREAELLAKGLAAKDGNQVYYLRGGMSAWMAMGFPIEENSPGNMP